MTIIECEECNTKMIASNYGCNNACDMCLCGNIQLIHLESHKPSKIEGFITLRWKRSYPKITEISELDRILAERAEDKQKTKKLGFG
jgi:hypothetical protein